MTTITSTAPTTITANIWPNIIDGRDVGGGGEEMLRLRAYEKLQNLVARGAVKKTGKKYKGLPSALAQAIAPQNGHIPAIAAARAAATAKAAAAAK